MSRLVRYLCLGLCIGILSVGSAAGAQPVLGSRATASLLTCGPGNDFYTTFGHSAIRITDPELGIDYVYNYGTFDFNTPNFYWKFSRGRLDYKLARTTFDRFMEEYAEEGRAVWEQPLCLETQQLENLFVLLETNLLPEYRYYRYDFFRDNCATRVRDVLQAAVPRWQAADGRSVGMSYRDYVHRATGRQLQWWALGIDLLLGLPVDHQCSEAEAMFYPLVLRDELAGTPLADRGVQVLEDTRQPLADSFPPTVVFMLLLLAVFVLSQPGRHADGVRRAMVWVDRGLFALAGLLGLFLCFMWFGTDHYCTAWNPNILWASPLLLLIAVRMGHSPRWALWLQVGCFAVALVWGIWCGVSPAIVLLDITLALRVVHLLFRRPARA